MAMLGGECSPCCGGSCGDLQDLPDTITASIDQGPAASLVVNPDASFFPGIVECWQAAVNHLNGFSGAFTLGKHAENLFSTTYHSSVYTQVFLACPESTQGELQYIDTSTTISLTISCTDGAYRAWVSVELTGSLSECAVPWSGFGPLILPTYRTRFELTTGIVTSSEILAGGPFSTINPNIFGRISRSWIFNAGDICSGTAPSTTAIPLHYDAGSTDLFYSDPPEKAHVLFAEVGGSFSYSFENPLP